MWFIYEKATGKLISTTPNAECVADPLNPEYEAVEFQNAPQSYTWDRSTRTPVEYIKPKRLTIETLMNRLTDDELDAIVGIRNNKATNAFLERIKHIRYIHPDDTKVQALFDFFIAQGAITAERKAELLAEGD